MRNIVLITWDSVRADHCSCYGYDKETTPFLDKIAKRGLKFENAIVRSLATPSSMSRIFTSIDNNCSEFLNSTNSCWRSFFKRQKTLAEVLQNSGFRTAGFHSNPYLSRIYGFNKGFQVFEDNISYYHEIHWIRKTLRSFLKNIKLLQIARVIFDITRGNTYERSIKFYDKIVNFTYDERNQNYFIWLLLIETHFPYLPEKFDRIKKGRIIRIFNKIEKFGGIKIRQNTIKNSINDNEKSLLLTAYDECIKDVDEFVKQLWNDLKDTDPIFIVHADHGEAFGEHGFFGHPPEHYEYLIRVPLVIYNADVKGVVKEPISLLRLAPTICELARVENEFPQPSLLEDVEYSPPIVENKLEDGFRVTVRDREWKLIVNPDREDELYNIKRDPLERENLIGHEPDIERELRKLAEMHLKRRMEEEKLRAGIEKLKKRFR